MPQNIAKYEAHARKLRELREAYDRDMAAGRIASVKKRRTKKRWYKFPRVIHKRPESGLWRWLRLKVWERDGWTCQYCGNQNRVDLQVDHVMPISKGGSNRLKNLVTACRKCNNKKLASVLPREKWEVVRAGIKERFLRRLKIEEESRELDESFRAAMECEE